jgi:hypothetical protein
MRPNRQAILAGLLVLVALGIWVFRWREGHPKAKPSAPSIPPTMGGQEVSTHLSPVGAIPQIPEGWAGNPFIENRSTRTTAAPRGLADVPILQGILWDDRQPSCIISGRVVTRGDQIGPWRVVEIERDRVVLSDGLTTKTLEAQ